MRNSMRHSSWSSEGKTARDIVPEAVNGEQHETLFLKQWRENSKRHSSWSRMGKQHEASFLKQWRGNTSSRSSAGKTPWNRLGFERADAQNMKQIVCLHSAQIKTVVHNIKSHFPQCMKWWVARTGHNTNVTSYDRDVWNGWPVVATDPSTRPTWSLISTNQRCKMLLFLAHISVTHAGITNNGLAHTDSVWFCRFWFNHPNTAKWF